MMTEVERAGLAARYGTVRGAIPSNVTLVAVSKTRSVEEVQALYDLGHRAFGENYIQELCEKQGRLPADIEWHFIGHLQSNKVKQIAPFVHLIHGVDSSRLLDELEKRAASAGRILNVLLQVHIAQEDTKHGFSAEELLELFDTPWRWPHVRIRGLMGMATNTDDDAVVSLEFAVLAALFQRLRPVVGSPDFDTLSMGMSGDAALTITAGSTLVRIGTAIFGERPAKLS